jgi:hypothetical protein
VTVHDVGQASVHGQEVDFIAMECISGRGLDRALAERRPSVAEALDIALQIAEALAAAHAVGIVHRDLKPANVMLSDAGRVKVLDFGLAKMTEGHGAGPAGPEGSTATRGSLPAETTAPMTRPGALVGTPAYMSPEQVDGKPVDARSDIFSLGALLYEMLAGRRPFRGDSPVSLLTAILRDPPPPLRSLRPDVPRYLKRVVDRCLAKRPGDRYASAAELLLDLTACRARVAARAARWRAALRQPRYAVPLAFAAVALVSFLGWTWARRVALPEIARLVEKNDCYQAYWLAQEAERLLPGDPQLDRFWKQESAPELRRTPSHAEREGSRGPSPWLAAPAFAEHRFNGLSVHTLKGTVPGPGGPGRELRERRAPGVRLARVPRLAVPRCGPQALVTGIVPQVRCVGGSVGRAASFPSTFAITSLLSLRAVVHRDSTDGWRRFQV